MRALHRKLLRDLRALWSQTLTLALVLAMGVACFVATFSAYTSLAGARDRFYAQSRFADVFASARRVPLAVRARLEALPGVAQVHTGVAQIARMGLAHTRDPIMGRLVGLERGAPPAINQVTVRSGRWPDPSASPREALVSEAFALARDLRPGDRITALVEGHREVLVITGLAVSPEYVFAGLGGSPDLRSFGVFWMDADALAGATRMRGAFNQVAAVLAPGAREEQVLADIDQVLAPYGATRAYGRSEQMSNRMLDSEITEQRVLGTVLPAIFLAVSAFLLQVVLSRQIARQREQIAALKALGYDNRSVGLHFIQYAGLVVAIAVLLGTALGAGLGRWLTSLYGEVFRLADLRYQLTGASGGGRCGGIGHRTRRHLAGHPLGGAAGPGRGHAPACTGRVPPRNGRAAWVGPLHHTGLAHGAAPHRAAAAARHRHPGRRGSSHGGGGQRRLLARLVQRADRRPLSLRPAW